MLKYIFKRILILIPLIFLVSFIVFALMDNAPGDPVRTLVGENMTEEQIEQKREELGFNDPLLVRYGRYMKGVFKGDFGKSLYGNKDVLTEYLFRLPFTVNLALISIFFTLIISIPIGIIAAVKQNTWIDAIFSAGAIMGLSIPGFWLGLMLVLLFSVKLGWFPVYGADEGLKSYILPAITLGVANASLLTRMTRSSLLDTIRQDYLKTVRAKGLSERKTILNHAFRNALIPIATIAGSQFSGLLSGSIIVENVFSWPGIGTLTVTAIRNHDITLATGCAVLTTMFTAVTLLIVDILYAFIDPRIKAQYTGK
ncbi:MAG: ABC transporter permease [Erysipelotrichia bacterium]|nr:ABC transporter permease [Erysipelotrichia bacterium]